MPLKPLFSWDQFGALSTTLIPEDIPFRYERVTQALVHFSSGLFASIGEADPPTSENRAYYWFRNIDVAIHVGSQGFAGGHDVSDGV